MESIIRLGTNVKEKLNINIYKYLKNIAMYVMIFFISKINFFEMFSVFGLALYVAGVKNKTNNLLFKAAIILGMLASNNQRFLSILICFMFFTFLIEYKNDKIKSIGFDLSRINIIKLSLMFGMLYFMIDLVLERINGDPLVHMPTFTYIKCLFNLILIVTTSTLFSKTFKILLRENRKQIRINDETIICIGFFIILSVIGTRGIFFHGLYLEELIIILMIEIIAYVTSGYISAFSGTLLGIPLILESKYMFNFTGLSLIGLIMGNVKKTSKWMYSLIFVIISLMFYFTMADSLNFTITFTTTIFVSQVIFLLIPKSIYEKLTEEFENMYKSKRKNYYEKFKNKVSEMIFNESEKFYNLAETYSKIESEETGINKNSDKREIIDTVLNEVCQGCVRSSDCLKNNFYKTYSRMLEDVSNVTLGEYNYDRNEIMMNAKGMGCLKPYEYVLKMCDECAKKKRARAEESPNNAMKKMLKKQLIETGRSIETIGREIMGYKVYRTHIEDELLDFLERKGVDADELNVFEDVNKKIEIEILMPVRYEKSLRKITKLVSKFFEKDYIFQIENCDKKVDEIKVKFQEKENYNLKYGVFQTARKETDVSGDRYSIMNFENGNTMISLADGMGKGKDARVESKTTLELLEGIMSLGFDDEYVIDFINTNMYDKEKEMYTTLDTVIVDRYTGLVKFIKNAAMTTYIKRKDEIIEIEANSMPIGIVKDTKASLIVERVEKGDQIFMLTDGVIDNINAESNKKRYFKKLLMTNNALTIQNLVKQIGLKITSENILKDDMTIIGIEIE